MLGVVFVRLLYYTAHNIRITYSVNMKLQVYAQLKTCLQSIIFQKLGVLPGPLYGRVESWLCGSILVSDHLP